MKMLKLFTLCSFIMFTLEEEYRLFIKTSGKEENEVKAMCSIYTGNTGSKKIEGTNSHTFYYKECNDNISEMEQLRQCYKYDFLNIEKKAIFTNMILGQAELQNFSYLLTFPVPRTNIKMGNLSRFACLGSDQVNKAEEDLKDGEVKRVRAEQDKDSALVKRKEFDYFINEFYLPLAVGNKPSKQVKKDFYLAKPKFDEANSAIQKAEDQIKSINDAPKVLNEYKLETEYFEKYIKGLYGHTNPGKKKLRKMKNRLHK
jgi:hypothetical protein